MTMSKANASESYYFDRSRKTIKKSPLEGGDIKPPLEDGDNTNALRKMIIALNLNKNYGGRKEPQQNVIEATESRQNEGTAKTPLTRTFVKGGPRLKEKPEPSDEQEEPYVDEQPLDPIGEKQDSELSTKLNQLEVDRKDLRAIEEAITQRGPLIGLVNQRQKLNN